MKANVWREKEEFAAGRKAFLVSQMLFSVWANTNALTALECASLWGIASNLRIANTSRWTNPSAQVSGAVIYTVASGTATRIDSS